MKPRIIRHPRTLEDIVEAYQYIALESPYASEEVAERFLDAVEETLAMLAAMPNMGRAWPSTQVVAGLRVFPVKGFERWFVFYTPLADGVHFRVLIHSARDLPHHLENFAEEE